MDDWLARMATARGVGVNIGLRVVLTGWPEGDLCWEGYFPEFRGAGGELKREIHDDECWDQRSIWYSKSWVNGPQRV